MPSTTRLVNHDKIHDGLNWENIANTFPNTTNYWFSNVIIKFLNVQGSYGIQILMSGWRIAIEAGDALAIISFRLWSHFAIAINTSQIRVCSYICAFSCPRTTTAIRASNSTFFAYASFRLTHTLTWTYDPSRVIFTLINYYRCGLNRLGFGWFVLSKSIGYCTNKCFRITYTICVYFGAWNNCHCRDRNLDSRRVCISKHSGQLCFDTIASLSVSGRVHTTQ